MGLGLGVLVGWLFERTLRVVGDDGECALGGDGLTQVIGVIGRIGHDDLGGQSLDQCGGLRCIALLARGKYEPHRTSQTANGHMYLGAQAPARAADRLIFRLIFRPLFSPRRRADAPERWWNRRSDIRSPDHRTSPRISATKHP